MTTIKDVAQRAGVSVATVSHVMNNSRAVSTEARDKVHAAIVALKYRRDGIARSLRVSQTGTIALLISDITNPFFAEMVRGIEDCVHTRGKTFNILLCNTEENDERERRALDMVLEKRIDGIIIVPTGGNAELLQDLVDGGLPIVLADRHLAGLQADSVIVDNRAASFAITDHLIRLGHRRIGALAAESRREFHQGSCRGLPGRPRIGRLAKRQQPDGGEPLLHRCGGRGRFCAA